MADEAVRVDVLVGVAAGLLSGQLMAFAAVPTLLFLLLLLLTTALEDAGEEEEEEEEQEEEGEEEEEEVAVELLPLLTTLLLLLAGRFLLRLGSTWDCCCDSGVQLMLRQVTREAEKEGEVVTEAAMTRRRAQTSVAPDAWQAPAMAESPARRLHVIIDQSDR
jgi:hypothetical protein